MDLNAIFDQALQSLTDTLSVVPPAVAENALQQWEYRFHLWAEVGHDAIWQPVDWAAIGFDDDDDDDPIRYTLTDRGEAATRPALSLVTGGEA